MIVNGYWIERIECSRQWGAMRVGDKRGGMIFRTRAGAIKWAMAQPA